MPFYDANGNHLTSLSEYLGIAQKQIIQVAGAGGKTTLLSVLAVENQEKKVCVTTTTKRYRPDDKTFVIKEGELLTPERLKEARGYVEAGRYVTDRKVCYPGKENLKILIDWADLTLIEADGSRCLPLKCVYPHEPVFVQEIILNQSQKEMQIPVSTIIVAGLNSLGKKMRDACYGYELVSDEIHEEEIITTDIIARLLSRFFLEPFHHLNPQVVLSHADTPERIQAGIQIFRELKYSGVLMDIVEV